MNEKLETPGLVIREKAQKENNSLLTILTATQGVVTATAYGARKTGATLAAGTKLFNYADFSLVSSRGRYKVDAARPIESFFGLSRSMEALTAASYFAEVLYDVCVTGQPDVEVLRLALNCLYLLMKGRTPIALVKAIFELRLLSESGFAPDLEGCADCAEEAAAYFSASDACLYCASCGEKHAGSLFSVSPGVVQAMRHIVSAPMEKLFSFSLGKASLDALGALCERYLTIQTGRSYDTLNPHHSLTDGVNDGTDDL